MQGNQSIEIFYFTSSYYIMTYGPPTHSLIPMTVLRLWNQK